MSRHRIVIDTDPGVDDAAAILLASASPEIDLLGITVVAGNVPLEAALANACRTVCLSGRTDVPVMAGAGRPLLRDQVFGKHAEIGVFPERLVGAGSVVASAEHAVRFIVRQARAAAKAGAPITLCALGPLTNVALALRMHPDVVHGIGQIVCMGGAFAVPGNRVPWAEFNVYADPHAAQIVFGSGVPLVLCPLDVTTQALFTPEHVVRLRSAGGAAGRVLANLLTEYDRSDPARYGRPGGPLHDPMTVAWLLAPGLFRGRACSVAVQTGGIASGQTHADFNDPSARATLLSQVDEPGYIALVIDRIAALGAAPTRPPREKKAK